jgi:hypothetical protein
MQYNRTVVPYASVVPYVSRQQSRIRVAALAVATAAHILAAGSPVLPSQTAAAAETAVETAAASETAAAVGSAGGAETSAVTA